MKLKRKFGHKNFIMKFKLPDAEQFASKDRRTAPYIFFYKWAIAQAMPLAEVLYKDSENSNIFNLPHGLQPDVSGFWLCAKDYEDLRNVNVKWLKHCKARKSEISMLELQAAPTTFPTNTRPSWAAEGYVYLTEDYVHE